eukprot:2308871-Amphidinium_carterae.1
MGSINAPQSPTMQVTQTLHKSVKIREGKKHGATKAIFFRKRSVLNFSMQTAAANRRQARSS